MLEELFKNPTNLRRYYAGQAIVGLLANSRAAKTLSEGEDEQLAKEALSIANALVKAAWAAEVKPQADAVV